MQAKEDGLDVAIEDTTAPATNTPITNGQVKGFSNNTHDFDWNPGVRAGIGFYLDHDAWNLEFDWTWLNITNYKHANATTALGVMLPLWALGSGTPVGQIGSRMSAKWDVDYNTFDIRLGKPYYVSRYFVVCPHFGLRGGWIDQHYAVDIGGQNASAANRSIMHANNDFWGVGARCGVDNDWVLGKGWCLFGNVAASMLFGKFSIDQNYSIPVQAGANGDGYDLNYHIYQNVPNVEMALGIGWGKYFNKKRNHVGIRLAYEFHEWWDQLNLRKFSSGSTGIVGGAAVGSGIYDNDVIARGNFTLNGFSLCVRIDI